MSTAPASPTDLPGRTPGRHEADAAAVLARLRVAAGGLLLARGVGLTLGALLSVGTALVLLDYALRLPAALRAGLLLAGLVGLGVLVRAVLLPALRFRPPLAELALRVERLSPPGSGVRDALASAVELADDPANDLAPSPMRALAVRRALAAFDPARARGVLDTRPAWRAVALALAAGALAAGIAARWPDLASTGVRRLLTPWTDAAWPARYLVADLTTESVHAADRALPLRAGLVRAAGARAGVGVDARVRVRIGEGLLSGTTRWQRLVLTDQGRRTAIPAEAPPRVAGRSGELFERLIEPELFAAAIAEAAPDAAFIEYELTTPDDRAGPVRVRLVTPPALADATVTIDPPAYAGAMPDAGFASGRAAMGDGLDDRATVRGVLAGSRVRLELALNKPLGADRVRTMLTALLDDAAPGTAAEIDARDDGATVTLSIEQPLELTISLTDRFGIPTRDPATLRLEVLADQPASVAIVDPARDEGVLASAVVPLRAQARDDLGLRSLRLVRLEASGTGEDPGLGADAEQLAEADAAGRDGEVLATLDLGELTLTPGDSVLLAAEAADGFERDGIARPATRSAVRTLRVIDEAELRTQIQAELSGVRRTAERLDAAQADLERAVGEASDDRTLSQARAGQAGVTPRLDEMRAAVRRVADRRELNRLEDDALEALLDDAQTLLGQAASASAEAAEALARPDAEAARDAQREVRDRIGQLAERLDRGEDAWVVRRALERLRDAQAEITAQTQRLAEAGADAGAGEEAEGATAPHGELAQRQAEAARRAGEALDQIDDRAEALRPKDALQAAALQQAARSGRAARLQQRLEEAAERLEENQSGAAGQEQQAAMQAIEQMLDELNNAERQRDSVLRRTLASLVQSLQSLVEQQHRELGRLLAGEAVLDAGMIRLNQNTLAVRAEADAGLSELRRVAELLGEAGTAQSDAIVSLRAELPALAEAERHERRSLSRLEEALAEAQRQSDRAEERERERLRKELRAAYLALAERQGALALQTEALVGKELSRRERAGVRTLGAEQGELRREVANIPARFEALSEAAAFGLAHRRIDQLLQAAAEDLGRGEPTGAAWRRQRAAAGLLADLAASLDDQQPDPSQFEDGATSGGEGQGGGQPQPPIPPVAELKVLRSLQQQLAERTRELGEAGDADAGELSDLGLWQREVAESARGLVERSGGESADNAPADEPAQDGLNPDERTDEQDSEEAGG